MQGFKKVIKEFLPKVGSVAIKQILCFKCKAFWILVSLGLFVIHLVENVEICFYIALTQSERARIAG